MGYVLELAAAAIAVLLTYHVRRFLGRTASRLELSKSRGCKPPPKYPHNDPIFGIDLLLDTLKNLKAHRVLPSLQERFDRYGQTYQALRMGKVIIWTNDPNNLQAIHAVNFSDYGVQPLRRDATLPFLGEGVFTMDGPFWQHSRDIIRPTFTRNNVANLALFEAHFQRFLGLVPRDGSTVNLMPLLCRLVGLIYPCCGTGTDLSTKFL